MVPYLPWHSTNAVRGGRSRLLGRAQRNLVPRGHGQARGVLTGPVRKECIWEALLSPVRTDAQNVDSEIFKDL